MEGSTENATLARELLVGLRERGLDVTRPILVPWWGLRWDERCRPLLIAGVDCSSGPREDIVAALRRHYGGAGRDGLAG